MDKLFKIKKRGIHFLTALLMRLSFLFSDKIYLQLLFFCKLGYKLNVNNPKTFNEKLQWLKLYNRNPIYSDLVDKFAVKDFVAKKIGIDYIIPTLGVWNNFDEIDFNDLPNQFVLKCTHDSGGLVICKDKSIFDFEMARKIINKSLKRNYYRSFREWPYKNVPPRIIAEKYMEDESGELRDYKFFCFDGIVKCLQVDYDRFIEHHRNIYDTKWNLLPFIIKYPSKKDAVIPKPKNFEKMLSIAESLSKNIPHVRVDLYNINGSVYFGELTFYHGSGYEKFEPKEWERKFGDWIKLPPIKMGEKCQS